MDLLRFLKHEKRPWGVYQGGGFCRIFYPIALCTSCKTAKSIVNSACDVNSA